MSRLRWVPLAMGAWVALTIFMVALGVSLGDSALLAGFAIVQALTGMALWAVALRPGATDEPRDRLELVGIGLAIGSILAVLSGVLLGAVLPWHLGWLLPSVVALVAWLWPRRESAVEQGWRWHRPSLVGFGVAVVVGGGSIAANLTRYPLEWVGTWVGYHRDMLYFEALSTSVGVFGPGDSIFMSGTEVRYHWFAYAWAGQLAHTADAAPFATLTRLLPIVALVGSAALATTWAARLSRRTSVTVLAALLLVAGGYAGAVNGTILNFDSPSQALTTIWLLAFLMAVLAYLKGRGGTSILVVVAVLSSAMVGGKVSTGAVGVLPLALVAVVASIRREEWTRRAWTATVVSGAVAVATFVLVVAGSAGAGDLQLLSLASRASSVQGLNLDYSFLGIVLGTVALILAVMARWAGLAWLVGDPSWRWRPDVVVGIGLVAIGVLPIVILSQGVNETWFALSASAPLAVLSAVGVGAAWTSLQNRRAMWASVVLGAVVLVCVAVIWAQGALTTATARFWGPWAGYALAALGGLVVLLLAGDRRDRTRLWVGSTLTILVIAGGCARAMPSIAQIFHAADAPSLAAGTEVSSIAPGGSLVDSAPAPVMSAPDELLAGSPPDRTQWSRAEVEAADFVSGSTTEADILVTNETTSFLVPALTQRLTYMSGAPYQGLYGGKDSIGGIPARIATSLAFTRGADPQAFADLCAAGATWAWIALDGTPLRDWEPYARVEFRNDAVAVARLDRSRCP